MTIQKSRIRKTPNILTNEDKSSDTALRSNDQILNFQWSTLLSYFSPSPRGPPPQQAKSVHVNKMMKLSNHENLKTGASTKI